MGTNYFDLEFVVSTKSEKKNLILFYLISEGNCNFTISLLDFNLGLIN